MDQNFTRSVLSWYDAGHRDLPWRHTKDAYRIWISEIMLQQTRAETVVSYYERFLARYPDVYALADAPEEELLKAWEGLGYYSRARSLQKAAKLIVSQHGGELPADLEKLRALPGIGVIPAARLLPLRSAFRLRRWMATWSASSVGILPFQRKWAARRAAA